MKVLNFLIGLTSQVVTWLVRPRNLGIALLSRSSAFLAVLAGGFTIKAQNVAGVAGAFEFSTSDGLPGYLMAICAWLAVITWVTGLVMVVRAHHREWREAESKRVVVAELRGLVDTSDRPLKDGLPKTLVGRREDCLVDVRAHLAAKPPNVEEALKELQHLRREVRRARGGSARADVTVVAGGVMHVPLQFYAGTLLDDEGHVQLYEWERTQRNWKLLAEPDSGDRFDVLGLDGAQGGAEVVLAVSASYLVSRPDIDATFPGIPVVGLQLPRPLPNALWSEEMQAALTQQFLQTMAAFNNFGVQTVHLVLAAPFTLSFRFGMAYDQRNMPQLRCYQWERDQLPPYPWSVQMPKGRSPAVYLPTPVPTAVAA
jgi:hypothetical protein